MTIQQEPENNMNYFNVDELIESDRKDQTSSKLVNSTPNGKQYANYHIFEEIGGKAESQATLDEDANSNASSNTSNKMSPPIFSFALNNSSSSKSSTPSSSVGSINFAKNMNRNAQNDSADCLENSGTQQGSIKVIKHSIHNILGLDGVELSDINNTTNNNSNNVSTLKRESSSLSPPPNDLNLNFNINKKMRK